MQRILSNLYSRFFLPPVTRTNIICVNENISNNVVLPEEITHMVKSSINIKIRGSDRNLVEHQFTSDNIIGSITSKECKNEICVMFLDKTIFDRKEDRIDQSLFEPLIKCFIDEPHINVFSELINNLITYIKSGKPKVNDEYNISYLYSFGVDKRNDSAYRFALIGMKKRESGEYCITLFGAKFI
jgi:hypothetical protein